MKTLTCKQMGGPCDAQISGSSKEEIMNKGMEHVEAAHPEMAADIKKMAKDSPEMMKWQQDFDAAYDAAPEM